MPDLGAGDVLAAPVGLCVTFGPLLLWIGLVLGARVVGQRHPEGSRWRRLWVLPLASLAVQLLGIGVTVVMLVRSFGTVAETTAADRSAALAQGISEAMNATACGLALGAVLLVATVVGLVVGARRAPPHAASS